MGAESEKAVDDDLHSGPVDHVRLDGPLVVEAVAVAAGPHVRVVALIAGELLFEQTLIYTTVER